MTAAPLRILPLGGSNEVGLNATLYHQGRDAILVDYGALLGDDRSPAIQRIVPSIEPLLRDERRLHGLVLTHGHEDHIGAIPYLLQRLDVPVYGAPLSLALVRSRLERDGYSVRMDFRELEPGVRATVGPFEVEPVTVTHSIPESAMIAIRSDQGLVVHTGDFKLDREPVQGATDDARLASLADEGVDLLLSDSTNAERAGRSATETSVVAALSDAIAEARGRVVVTFVSSHLHRLQALAEVARRLGRRLLLLGAAFERNRDIATRLGLLGLPSNVTTVPEAAARLPRDQLLIVATGSQGEWGGAMARLSRGEGPVPLEAGDRVIFSARVIPGREVAVRTVVSRLAERGVEVIEARRDRSLHTSGHAQAEEQAELIQRLKPETFAPIHGDRVMLAAHAATARAAGMAPDRIFVIGNGQSLELAQGRVARGSDEDAPRVALDGAGDPLPWSTVRARQTLARQGVLACTVLVDDRGRPAADPSLVAHGFDLTDDEQAELRRGVRLELEDRTLVSIDRLRERAVATLRRMLARSTPVVLVQVLPTPRSPREG